jgi:hypothetical protein
MGYIEMGKEHLHEHPMLIAEKLEVDLQTVRVEHAPPDDKLYMNPLLGFQATGNSNAIRVARMNRCDAPAPPRGCCWSGGGATVASGAGGVPVPSAARSSTSRAAGA